MQSLHFSQWINGISKYGNLWRFSCRMCWEKKLDFPSILQVQAHCSFPSEIKGHEKFCPELVIQERRTWPLHRVLCHSRGRSSFGESGVGHPWGMHTTRAQTTSACHWYRALMQTDPITARLIWQSHQSVCNIRLWQMGWKRLAKKKGNRNGRKRNYRGHLLLPSFAINVPR